MALNPPLPTPTHPVEDVLHGHTLVDPYRWLEDGESPETRDWVAKQNAYTREVLDGLEYRERLRDRLDELLTVGTVGCPHIRGNRYFYSRRDGRQDQPVLVVRDGPEGDERVLLDPAARGRTVALDWWFPSNDGALLAYGLSEGGDELSTLRLMDVSTGQILPGEEIPRTRAASVAWLPDASGFYYTRYPQSGDVPEGDEVYHRHVYLHRLGTPWRDDPVIFGPGRAREDWPEVDISHSGRWLGVLVSQGWAKSELFLRDLRRPDSAWIPLHVGVEAWADFEFGGDQLFVRTNEDAPNYQVFEVDPAHPARMDWRLIMEERDDRVINSVRAIGSWLVAEELENASSRLRIYELTGEPLREVVLPALGTLTGIGGEWGSPVITYGYTSFVQPAVSFRLADPLADPQPFASGELPPGLDASLYRVDQVWYPSKDGTQISMFVIRRHDVEPDGNRPVVLTGYGGFNVAMTPSFIAALPMWLDAGGVYALPNLRGGGEYGEAWHQAGMLGRKQSVFDDFIAAAEWLIANNYTCPERLAIRGGSNGGLLVGAALTQRPDLFKAIVCQVPLLDMLRYHHLRIARLWIPEYGSVEDPKQFEWLHAYSPYHHISEGVTYPATLLMTAEGDSRVDPMHARKMAAALQATGSKEPVLLRVESEAGHGQGKPRGKVLDEGADVWGFIYWQLGVENV